MSLVIVQPHRSAVSETFIRAHTRLPTATTVLHGFPAEYVDGPILSSNFGARALRRIDRMLSGKGAQWEMTRSLLIALKDCKAEAVLAEYGTTGAHAAEACHISGVPLIVHFHGYDASHTPTLRHYGERYRQTFLVAKALVVVSRPMQQALLDLGAPADKIHFCPYGVDTDFFSPPPSPELRPPTTAPLFIAVGRLVEKKAPHLLLLAFANVLAQFPKARLQIIGDGPLRGVCRDLVPALAMEHAVTFLGERSPQQVRDALRGAQVFVQHSVTAFDGDSEGTPVAILEASASGLPVVSTHHAGISEAVIEGATGFLVEPGNSQAMAERMTFLCRDSAAAQRLGANGRQHVLANYAQGPQLAQLWSVIHQAIEAAKQAKSVTALHQSLVMVPVG